MTCQQYDADLVDLARGRPADHQAAASVRRHLDGCAACAARFERERRLTAGLRAVAATAGVPANDVAEQRLMSAFSASHASRPRAGRRSRLLRWPALAAAACLLVVLGAWAAVEWRGREATAERVAAVARAAWQAPPEQPRLIAEAERPSPAPAPLATRRSRASVPRVVRAARRGEAPRDTDRFAGFIPLPAAGGLPGFDSGMIVRVTIPTASLPAFGLVVAPEATQTVNADVLVGQDGQARAIRLVSLVGGSRREPQ